MIVYHGGTQRIEQPLVHLGRAGLDFGQGFYVTDIRQQAEDWADRMARTRLEPAKVNVYELDIPDRNSMWWKAEWPTIG